MEEKNMKTHVNQNNDDLTMTKKSERSCTLKDFRRYFREYCEHSSINGFIYLSEKRSRIERIFWIIVIVLSFVVCFYFIIKIYGKFEENPFIVSLDTKVSSIYSIPFPAVTICPMTKALPTKVNFTNLIHKLWDNETLNEDEIKNAQYMSLICDFDNEDVNKSLPQLKTITHEFYDQLHDLQLSLGQLSLCSFLDTEYDTCDKYFSPIILDEGKCYTFNMLSREKIFREQVYQYHDYHQNKKTTDWNIENGYPKTFRHVYPRRALLAGTDNALEIFLLEIQNNMDYICSDILQGFKVLLHTPHSVPQLRNKYFIVPLDSSVTAAVDPHVMTTSKEVQKYSPEKRLCYFSEERYLCFFKIYTTDNCKLECLTNQTLERCGCVNYHMPRLNTTPICGNGMMSCMNEAERDLKKLEMKENMNPKTGKKCNCLPLCTDVKYDSRETQLPMNWRAIFRALRFGKVFKGIDLEKKLHVSKLTVYFKSEQFISSQRNELYGPFDFLANFGGLLGLFNGFSILSLAEIIYYLTMRLWCNTILYNNIGGQ